MTDFRFTLQNTSGGEQSWTVQNLVTSDIEAGGDLIVNLDGVTTDLTMAVTVATQVAPIRQATGTLNYNNATGTWTFAATTGGVFGFAYDAFNRRITLSCSV